MGASVLLSLMPGPDNIYVLTESITKGYRNGVYISLGLVTGVLVHTVAAATGLSIVIQNSPLLFSLLKVAGAGYLIYMAIASWNEKKTEIELQEISQETKKTNVNLVRTGFLMNVLNPKVSLFFIAFLPQFVQENSTNKIGQMLILGVVFMLQAFLVFGAIAIFSGSLYIYASRDSFWRITKWSKITVLLALALALLFSQQ